LPPAPTSQTPIAVKFTTEPLGDCGPTTGEVTIAGNAVHVRLFRTPAAPSCLPTIAPRVVQIDLGTLPIGEYALTAEYQKIEWSGRFVVRSPAHVWSRFGSYGGAGTRLCRGRSQTAARSKNVVLQAPVCTTDPCDALVPSFAIIPDLEQAFPQIAQLDSVRIEIEPAAPFRFWAFASITNNATQHVTLVTPE